GGQPVDVLSRRVDAEAGARGRSQVEALMEWHRAVVAGPDRDPIPVAHLRDVVRMDRRQVERDDTAALVGIQRAVELDLRDLARKDVEGVLDEPPLVL